MERVPLRGRTAVVTGASRGIGAATARALDEAGARVALVSRGGADLDEVAAGLVHEPLIVAADLRLPDTPHLVAGQVLERFGSVDILVNNAATAARLDTVDTGAALIDELLAVNVRSPLLLIGALVPSMTDRGRGSIINLSSASALVGTPRRAAYAASKGAMDAATRSLAIELGPSGIRVNSVAPGVVDTALWAKNKAIPGVVEAIEGQTPLRRWAAPEDIADVIVFLASDAARFVTGETIAVDGGIARTLDLFAGPV
jgi:NAD(P)-dependent dehydrogenase (short-subunit alcohol dehydrogenase family)